MRFAKIIVHCSDSDIDAHDNIDTLRRWHIARNFSDVGYHFFIRKNSTLEIGRPLTEWGAHTRGENHDSIGICLSGRKDFQEEQFNTLHKLLKTIFYLTNLNIDNVYPHSHFSQIKTCPNFDFECFKRKFFCVSTTKNVD